MKNLENNAFMHTQQLVYVSVVATFDVILNYVKRPSPDLFLANPVLWMSMLDNASAIVMMQALRHVGLPTHAWHQCARANATPCDAHPPPLRRPPATPCDAQVRA